MDQQQQYAYTIVLKKRSTCSLKSFTLNDKSTPIFPAFSEIALCKYFWKKTPF